MNELVNAIESSLGRLVAAASALECLAGGMAQGGGERSGEVEKITAAVEALEDQRVHELMAGASRRERELMERLAEAEETITSLQAAQAASGRLAASGRADNHVARKTLPAATIQLLAKGGIEAGDVVDVQSLDAALAGLSVEQRIAVKAQMVRTGSLTLTTR